MYVPSTVTLHDLDMQIAAEWGGVRRIAREICACAIGAGFGYIKAFIYNLCLDRSLSVRRRALSCTGSSPSGKENAAGGAENLDVVQEQKKHAALAYPPEHYFDTHKVAITLQSLGRHKSLS